MIVLGLDSSTSACSAALWRDGVDGGVLARRFAAMARGQSEALMPMAAEVMAEAGLRFSDVGLIAVTVGPGAFTGLRIGLAAARAMSLAAGLPIAGVSTSEAIAAAAVPRLLPGHDLIVAIESKRADLFVQAFAADGEPLAEVAPLLPELVPGLVSGPVMLAGDGAARLAPDLPDCPRLDIDAPDAAVVAALAAARFAAGTARPPVPLYLRPADVTLPPGAA